MQNSSLESLLDEIKAQADPERTKTFQWFFKTGKGQYGEGDKFLGLTVPTQRKLAKKYRAVRLPDIRKLLSSPFHEHRLIALLILVDAYERGNDKEKEEIFQYYLKRTKYINNWDLVDTSAYKIVGKHLVARDRDILFRLAKSDSLWERRIAIISTYQFILHGDTKTTYEIAYMLLDDKEDLIHKAVGWMLREAGKRVSEKELKEFLAPRYQKMPRTMLRYAIEKFDEKQRKYYLAKDVSKR